MGPCLKPIFANAIAVVKSGNDETVLRVREPSIEMLPFDEPRVTLECTVDRTCKQHGKEKNPSDMRKKKVIYNPPATIVLWEDGTKTVVKCDERDTYDPKYGMALCYMKKALGNTSRALNDILHEEANNHE